MFTRPKFSDAETAFILRHVAADGQDPIGAFLAAFDPGGDPCSPELGPKVAEVMERQHVKMECYVQWRMKQERAGGSLLLELEEARRKALSEPDGSVTAAEIAVTKAQALGLLQAPGAVRAIGVPADHVSAMMRDGSGDAFIRVPGSAASH